MLTLKPYHIPYLREAMRARNLIVQTITTSTATDRAVCAELEKRIDLLARAVETEQAANEARKKYNQHIYSTPEPEGRRARKEARKLAAGQAQEQGAGIDTTVTEKPLEAPPKPPQGGQKATTSAADVVKRPL